MISFERKINDKQVTFEIEKSSNDYYVTMHWDNGFSRFKATPVFYNGQQHLKLNTELPEMLKGYNEAELFELVIDNKG